MASERVLGNAYLAKLGASDDPVLCQVSHNFNANSDEIEATCKEDSLKFLLSGKPGYEFSVVAELDEANTTNKYSFKQVVDDLAASNVINFLVGSVIVGDTIFSGTCTVATWELTSDLDDVPSWTATFKVRTLTIAVGT